MNATSLRSYGCGVGVACFMTALSASCTSIDSPNGDNARADAAVRGGEGTSRRDGSVINAPDASRARDSGSVTDASRAVPDANAEPNDAATATEGDGSVPPEEPALPRVCDAPATDCAGPSAALRCNDAGQWEVSEVCADDTPVCVGGACVACQPDQVRCAEGSGAPERCVDGTWQAAPACAGHCLPETGQCVDCMPGSEQCHDRGAQRCSPRGVWEDLGNCAGDTVNCAMCDLGQPCSGDTDCAGRNCVAQVCRPVENCSNGMDDDQDGDVDCADSACSAYRCLAVPSGWTGPITVTEGSTVPSSCPAPYVSEQVEGDSGRLTWQPASCAPCVCGGISCGSAQPAMRAFPFPDCDDQIGSFPMTMTSGQCHSAVISAHVTSVPGEVGTCRVTSGGPPPTSTPQPAFWSERTLGCGLSAPSAGGCASSQVCAPATPAGFEQNTYCIHRTGTHTCPADYPTQRMVYDGYSSTRTCAACGPCGTVGSCGRITRYAESGCTGASVTTTSTIKCWSGSTYATARWSPDIRCTASGGGAIGTVTGRAPVTVCCNP